MQHSEKHRLLLSIHDVSPAFATQVETLFNHLANVAETGKLAMLVVPDHWGANPINGNAAFQMRLRTWADQGVEMFVHGWYHKDMARHHGRAAIRARFMTAGEGEFLGLSRQEAAQRMADGKSLIENIIGRPAAGFIAPAWLYGEGALFALRESRFALAEDHMKVWAPQTDKVLARGPVITWASRSPSRTASSLAFAALARRTLHPLKTVRIAVHPDDTTKTSIMESIRSTVASFARRRRIGAYHELAE